MYNQFRFSIQPNYYYFLLLQDEDYMDYENDLFQIIDNMQNFNYKVLLLEIFYKRLHNAQKISEYQTFLSSNFFKLGSQAVYVFVFNGWISTFSC